MSRDCVHGSLARSCELCYLQTEIVRLKAEVVRDHSLCIGENEALAAERDRLTDGIRSIAARRCLCHGHSKSPGHGGPCCGVAGGRCVTCEARALLDVAGDDTEHRYSYRDQDEGLSRCVCGGVWSDEGCDLVVSGDDALDEIVRVSEEAGLHDDDPPVPYRALEGSEGGEDAT